MVVFDTETTFDSDGAAVIWARVIDGSGCDTRFRLCITRGYAERAWRIRYSRAEVTTQIWVRIDDLRERVAREIANGKAELVL